MDKPLLLYILEGIEAVPVDDHIKWAMWRSTNTGRVKRTETADIIVSTVFLGINHNYTLEGPPLLFETMVFGGSMEGYCRRYSTWEEAMQGHDETLELVYAETGQFMLEVHQN